MSIFGDRLKELRKNRGLTQEGICEIFLDKNGLPVTKQTISYYESGKYEPNFDGLLSASKFFGVTVDYLIGNAELGSSQHEYIQIKTGIEDRNAVNMVQFSIDKILEAFNKYANLTKLPPKYSKYRGLAYSEGSYFDFHMITLLEFVSNYFCHIFDYYEIREISEMQKKLKDKDKTSSDINRYLYFSFLRILNAKDEHEHINSLNIDKDITDLLNILSLSSHKNADFIVEGIKNPKTDINKLVEDGGLDEDTKNLIQYLRKEGVINAR